MLECVCFKIAELEVCYVIDYRTNEKIEAKSVSKDTEKTKERFKEDFGASTASQKRGIAEVCGQTVRSFYRVHDTGTITAKALLATSSELNVSPFYYSGETDEKVPCSDELIKQFLEWHGYGEILDELNSKGKNKPKRANSRKSRVKAASDAPVKAVEWVEVILAEPMAEDVVALETKTKKVVASETEIIEAATPEVKTANEPASNASKVSANIKPLANIIEISAVDNLGEEEAVTLLKALFIRAKAGGNAAADLDEVKRLLLS